MSKSSQAKAERRGTRLHAARALMALLGALPFGACRAAGAGAGLIGWYLRSRARRVTLHNLALCFPGMPTEERLALGRRSLIEDGMGAAEIAWCWRRPRSEWLAQRVQLVGEEHRNDTLDDGRGTLIVTPHQGAWEVGLPIAAGKSQLRYFYRPPRDASLEPILREGRSNMGGLALRLDAGGIRDALKALRSGLPVGILPDQEPDRDGGDFAPFFGTPALTMTLLARLAARSNARVMFLVAIRCKGGWRGHYLPAEPGIADADPAVATAALNRSIERCVALAPAQYLWSYRRFRELPQGGRRDYRAPL